MRSRIIALCALTSLVTLKGCGGGDGGSTSPTSTVAIVDVTPATATVNVGASQQLAAAPKTSTGTLVAGKTATWSTAAATVATVDATGLVRGVGAGTAAITATVDGKSGTATITVVALPVASVTVAPATVSVAFGSAAQLTASPKDASGTALTGRTVTWTSANTTVATVSGTGLVTAGNAGTTTVTATSEGKSGSATIIVTPNSAITFAASGRVVEAAGAPGIAGARVTAQDANATVLATTTTDATGNWTLSGLAAGTNVQFAVSATGYVSTLVAPTPLSAPLAVESVPLVRTSTASGGVSGRARDASTNAAITTGIAVELRDGMNAVTGLALQTTTTAADGSYTLAAVAAGTYTLVMRGAGYTQTSRTVAISGGATLANADLTLSANANANQWRAVLTWVSAARDLDLYLTLPGTGSTRQQVYFLQPGNCGVAPFACLDRDAAAAPGPETITISQLGTGTYRFYVHNYNTPSSATDNSLMLSGAQLRIFRGATQMGAYSVPQLPGTLWTVVELDGATGTVTTRNTIAAGAPGDPVATLRAPDARASRSGKTDPGLRLP
ncbi:MAG: Ig-like domain-containing protein [Gemmatimonadota bacterium]|nr:Ig-like domain-containing protein [Gemmatimonadota bacterium]